MIRLVGRLRELDRRMRRLRPGSAGFWLACVPSALFIAIVMSIHEWPRLRAAVAGSDGIATIVSRDCSRDQFEYEFDPSPGDTVRARASASQAGVPCANLTVGATVAVKYIQDGRPAYVVTKDPMRYVRTRVLLIAAFVLATVGLTALVMMAFHERPDRPS